MELVEDVYRLTARFPESERFGVTSQMRRAAVSIPSNIAEGSARGTKKEYARFLNISRGSLAELETLLTVSKQLGLSTEVAPLKQKARRLFPLLAGLSMRATSSER